MGGPYKLKKRGKPMTTIYDAAILLVDDNPDLLTLVTDNLRTAGYKSVCTAADCAAARAAFAAHRPDLMILDINLPDGDGFGLFRTLRTESDVPALFLSARATRPPCCTPCRPVKQGRIRPTFWVCTSSSRSSAPTAARRPLPGTHRAGQRRCWCCR